MKEKVRRRKEIEIQPKKKSVVMSTDYDEIALVIAKDNLVTVHQMDKRNITLGRREAEAINPGNSFFIVNTTDDHPSKVKILWVKI